MPETAEHTYMFALLIPTLAWADLPEEERWLANDRLAVGVAADGSLINEALSLGLLWDPDGPAGTTPVGGDLLDQGWALEGWLLDGRAGAEEKRWTNAAAHLGSELALEWAWAAEGPDAIGLRGQGGDADLGVQSWLLLGAEGDGLWLVLRLTALTPLTELRVARLLDLDPDAWVDGGYDTLNASGEGWSSASGAWDGRSLAMASAGGQGALCAWCEDIDGLLAGAGENSVADEQIGVVVELGDLEAGEVVDVVFAYALSLDHEEAVALAEAMAALPDADGDGVEDLDADCAPGDAAAGPGAEERWNGQDDDCDGVVDEDTVGADDDGDGLSEAEGDCDDADPAVHPGAAPTAGVADADCDGAADDGSWGELPDTGAGEEAKPTGCAVSGGAAGPLALILICLALIRRTR